MDSAAGLSWSGGAPGTVGGRPDGIQRGTGGRRLCLAHQLPDPPHAIVGRLRVVAELLRHQADAATDAGGKADAGSGDIGPRYIVSPQEGAADVDPRPGSAGRSGRR